MEITEVRIKLVRNGGNERLRAFCSVTLDGDFVVRDLKVIDGVNGPFVAMPSRKLMDRCQRCGSKNHLRARFCNECGNKLNESRAPKDAQGRAKLHADVAHPINAPCRERVQAAVVEAYQAEIERAKEPDYRPASFDDFEDLDEELPAAAAETSEPAAKRPAPAPAEPRRPAPAEEEPVAKDDDAFGDYNALIADLKRDAQQRRPDTRDDRGAGHSHEAGPARGAGSPTGEPTGRPEPRPDADRPPQPEPPSPPPKSAPSSPAPPSNDEFGEGL